MVSNNTVPLAILATYLLTCLVLTIRCITIIRSSNTPSQQRGLVVTQSHKKTRKITLFSILAIVSLATTWTYMLSYFRWSYFDWADTHNPAALSSDELYLGEWLRDTSLFQQAWFSALESKERSWWTLQIFGFCAVWSLSLSVQGRKRNIPKVWCFMLLGQIVAISFASNLFFLAVLLHDEQSVPQPSTTNKSRTGETTSSRWWLFTSDSIILLANLAFVAVLVTGDMGTAWFLPALLAPHILAFVPILRDSFSSSTASSPASHAGRIKDVPRLVQFSVFVAVLAAATSQLPAERANLAALLQTLYEHPAVSSVGWDVICCWVSYTAWAFFGNQ
ncbi:hypothetical protein QBC35DRAFT_396746 [Podospora australis]|uniref:Uncharacterized protein n=1 Tax=Podospora australis TaxID=1536484 RepID=A0AAN7AD18_9PEZI|nr:hypothetical protein QBC35DRAFT_396746 [Podospora australis]